MGTGTYESWPVDRPIVKENVRKHFSEESLRRHAESLKKDGQLRPLLVLRDCTLVAGERSLRAAKLAGLTHVDVKILDRDVDPREFKKLQLIENLMREGLEDREIYVACKELTANNPELLKKDLMAELHFDASMAPRIFAVDNLIPAAKEAFLAGAFRFSKAYEIAKASEQEQHQMLAAILSGTSRDEIKRQVRKGRNETTPTIKLSRVKCLLPSGVCIVVSGESLSLDNLIDSLGELQKEAKKARDQNLDAKTFQAVLKDKAKAG